MVPPLTISPSISSEGYATPLLHFVPFLQDVTVGHLTASHYVFYRTRSSC